MMHDFTVIKHRFCFVCLEGDRAGDIMKTLNEIHFECLHYHHLWTLVEYVIEDKCHPEALGIEVE